TRAIGLSMVHSTNSDITTEHTQALSDDVAEEEEEKKRRRAALIGLALPVMGDALIPGQPFASNAPLVQGTPQFGGAPTVQGTPQFGTGSPPSTSGGNIGSGG